MTLASAIILLFLVIDPFGNVPFFVSALKDVDPARRRRVVIRELLIAYFVMVVFLFVGGPFLKVLGISGPALTIAGGVILFLIALRMVFPNRNRSAQEDLEGEPFIVPLAIPYVAGSGRDRAPDGHDPGRHCDPDVPDRGGYLLRARVIAPYPIQKPLRCDTPTILRHELQK